MTVMELAGGSPLFPAFCEQLELCTKTAIPYIVHSCSLFQLPPQIVSDNCLHLQYPLLTLGVLLAPIEGDLPYVAQTCYYCTTDIRMLKTNKTK